VREEPLEPPDELTRKVVEEQSAERRRDDDAVRDDLVDALTAAFPGIRELQVTVVRGEATVEGVVEDRATEVEAYRLAARVPGVVDVVGRLGRDAGSKVPGRPPS
jgi:osmotically-inducible protein OsmY